MKSYQEFINQVNQINDIEDLEITADFFQFGIEKGWYSKRQSDDFNQNYWKIKNKLITESIYKANNKKLNYIQLLSIVTAAPAELKNNDTYEELVRYINDRIKALKSKKVA